MGTEGRELTREKKKIPIILCSSRSMQLLILNTLNIRLSCIRKFLN